MFRHFRPDYYYDSVFDINLQLLKDNGIKGIICDIDNTIVPYSIEKVNDNMINWLKTVEKRDFKICLVSNGFEGRVKIFRNRLNIPAIGQAVKPRKKAYKQALNILELNKTKVVVIGDQIFTDVLGGNRMGLKTILVNPLEKNDFFMTKLLRKIERLFFKREDFN